MREVRVNKAELIEVLTQNSEIHSREFEAAYAAYLASLRTFFERQLLALDERREPELYCKLPQPEDHSDDYARAIEMLDMALDEDVTLTQADFRQYVQDEWNWKQDFATTSSFYATGQGWR